MASEFGAIRVKPLLSVLDGVDPVEYLHDLLNKDGKALLYVRTPDGFRCDSWNEIEALEPRGLEGELKAQTERPVVENERFPSYLRLDHQQIRVLLARGVVNLNSFNVGGLFLRKENQTASIDFDSLYAIIPSKLKPMNRDIDRATLTAFDPANGHSMVVKSFDQRWKRYSYGLHGVSVKDLFIGIEAPVEPLAGSADVDAPDDPYNLKKSSPLVHAILTKAFDWCDRPKSEMKIKALSPKFAELNAGYEINPRPFNNGRDEFAAKLANRHFKEKATRGRRSRTTTELVPDDAFLRQSFVNDIFSRALYAACRWSGAMEPSLDHDPVRLMQLLCRLGFWDYEDEDEVSSLMFFISGQKQPRKGELDFQHA